MARTLVGIDLGTTYSLVAVLGDAGPRVLTNRLGEALTPSAVSVTDDGRVLVGAPARARFTTHPEATALSFKRDMGTPRTYTLSGRTFRPEELSALVLASLKADAEEALGHAVDEAVVTVPAYFGDLQRQATRSAGEIAGLTVERIINEPTAAALAYGLHERHREARVAVLDLGGGTFDVTVLEIIEGVIEVQASAGNVRLGGDDFDAALARRVAHRLVAEKGVTLADDPVTRARLASACELAKRRLSTEEITRIALAEIAVEGGARVDVELQVTRGEADDCWAELIESVRAPVLRALRDAGVAPGKIDDVLLVGGSTRMPCVARLAAQMFGRLPVRTLPPDEAVALGASVQAALKAGDKAVDDLVVTDIAPFTLGIASSTSVGMRRVTGVFSPILERGTVIPASRVETFSTVEDGQRKIEIEVYQGEHAMCTENMKLGSYMVTDIPAALAGHQSGAVRFTYDLNGILEVETTVVATGKTAALLIERSPGRLSAGEVEKAKAAMARLKIHPRDALPNSTALARADALFVELTAEPRAALGNAIALFRAALETQEARTIDGAREQLRDWTTRLSQ